MVLATPLVEATRKHFPEAEVHILVIPETAILLENNPHLDKVWPYDKRSGEKGLGAFQSWTRKLRHAHFDLALVPHRSLRSAALVFGAGIPVRVGFRNSAGRWLLNQTVRYPGDCHEVERNLELLRPFGWEGEVPPPQLFPGGREQKRIDTILSGHNLNKQPLVTIAPGSIWPTKRWLKERFAGVIQSLWKKHQVQCVLVGGPDDEVLAAAIVHLAQVPCLNQTGKLTLLESAELIKRCCVALTNDSAPCHLAAAVGTSVVAIFGATVPAFGFAPFGTNNQVLEINDLNCRPCGIHGGTKCPKKHFLCMKRIETEPVVKALERYL